MTTAPKHDYLKTKVTSLGAEAKLIRQYERARYRKASKLYDQPNRSRTMQYNLETANGLREHRLQVVQPEARWANIAYGFCRGRKYRQIENIARVEPDWDRIEKLVLTFAERDNPRHNQTLEQRFKEWVDEARDWWEMVANADVSDTLDVDVIGNNQIGFMEPNSEYQLNTRKAKKRAAYVPKTVCMDSEKGI
jgi:hypothetical protein